MTIRSNSMITLPVFLVLLFVCTAVGYWLIFRLGRATPIMLAVGAATILTWLNGALPESLFFTCC